MSIDEAKVGRLMVALATIGDHKKQSAALMPELCDLVERHEDLLPHELKRYMALASRYWKNRVGSSKDLEAARIACWEFLEKKGRSTGIVDAEDAAIRALICVLYDESIDAEFLDDATYWFFSVLKQIRESDPDVDERIDNLIAELMGPGSILEP
jgi:hypothetical protein